MPADHPDYVGYTGNEYQFKTPVRAGPFKFSVVGQISPDIARHYGLATAGAQTHQGRSHAETVAYHDRMKNPEFWGYTGRDHEFKTPVSVGRFKFSVVGSISPDVARHYGLDQLEAQDHATGRMAHESTEHESATLPARQGKLKMGFGTPRVGGVFGEIVMAKLAKKATAQGGETSAPGEAKTGDVRAGDGGHDHSLTTRSVVEHKDFLGFTGRDDEFKTPVRMGSFQFSVVGNISPEIARHYGIEHLGVEGRSHADHTATPAKASHAQEHGPTRGKFKLGFGPAKIGGVFGEIVTAKLAQRAMKQAGKATSHSAAGEKSGTAKGKPAKFKLSVTPHIGGVLGDKVTAKLALRARKQAAKSTPVKSPTAKKTA
ncbi:hypothetical protein HGR_07136 [Hylemonella gracilis ATCC 19624]|uniref:Uncharacterized protein n=1 Tax=Hylemonella gracilis ATCC 19624 TaxID=887062 RepID=F3KSJ8_9BURK|nr:hypothetical protein HGR_07136 [Hylemonella gracilis ATCC 19624]